jgi:hypothetical protein
MARVSRPFRHLRLCHCDEAGIDGAQRRFPALTSIRAQWTVDGFALLRAAKVGSGKRGLQIPQVRTRPSRALRLPGLTNKSKDGLNEFSLCYCFG